MKFSWVAASVVGFAGGGLVCAAGVPRFAIAFARRPSGTARTGAAAVAAALALISPAAALADEPPAPAWFEEVSAASGVSFVCKSGATGKYLFPEIILGGCALLDLENDGDLDIYFVQGGSLEKARGPEDANRLYRNDGGFRFVDITKGSGAEGKHYGIGVAAGDMDGDGDTDLYVTNVGPNTMLRNDGGGKFTDVTASSGTGHNGWGTSAAFFDADADSDLDLFVVNYLNWSIQGELECYNNFGGRDYCLPTNYAAPACAVLYRNDGSGTFTDATEEGGLRTAFGNGLGVTAADFNGDGRQDVFVANDTMMNQLWMNQGGGRFEDQALYLGCALDENGKAKAGMGVATADTDHDGDLDILVVNLERESDSFYANEGDFFVDRTALSGLGVASRRFTRFGVGLVDFNNDGELDLYEANGRVQASPEPSTSDVYAEANLLLRGVGAGRFEEVTPAGGTNPALVATSRGAAFGDLDDDGGVDLVVVNRDAPAHLLRNVVPKRGGFARFRVLERTGGDALGATVFATVAGRTLRREVSSAWSYASASDPRVSFGLGGETAAKAVRVRWADGTEETFGDLEGGRTTVLKRGSGQK